MTNATRRRVLLATPVGSTALALGACAPGEGGGASTQTGPVSIQYLGRGSAGEEEIYRTLIKDFEGRNPAIKVDVNWAGTGGADLIAEKITALLAGGTPPDTFWVHSASTIDFADQKILVDLTPYTKEKGFDLNAFYKGPVDDFRWESQLIALPRETSSLVMFFNKQQFAENGVKEFTPETTWAEWLDGAKCQAPHQGGA